MIYYLNPNKQSSVAGGNYEVHTKECRRLPEDKSRYILLGNFKTPREAVIFAKQHYLEWAIDIDGCFYCCKSENKG